jgi:hypothetical protein
MSFQTASGESQIVLIIIELQKVLAYAQHDELYTHTSPLYLRKRCH